MSLGSKRSLVTRFGPSPLLDDELATRAFVLANAATITNQVVELSTTFSTTSTSKVAITLLTLTLGASGNAWIQANINITNTGVNNTYIDIFNATIILNATTTVPEAGGSNTFGAVTHTGAQSGEVITVRMSVGATTGSAQFASTTNNEIDSGLRTMEFS